jgi:hypothetical protein
MTQPVRRSQATTKPVAKQARARIPVTARACGSPGQIHAGRRFPNLPAW